MAASAAAALSAFSAGHAPLAQHDQLRAAEIGDRRRLAWSCPASTRAPQLSAISAGTSSSRAGSGSPWRFLLVAATAPTVRTTGSASDGRSGTRMPIVSSRVPVSQRKRRAGFGRISVYGRAGARGDHGAASAGLRHGVEDGVQVGGE